MMRIIALQSGSNGNCIYIESGDTRLLVDAGISGICAQNRLSAFGIDIRSVSALLITHDHRDHVANAGVFHRKFKIPVWMTPSTHEAVAHKVGKVADVRHFSSNSCFALGSVNIEAVSTPHDAVDGVCFVVDDGRSRFGICTDLGHVFSDLPDLVASLDGVLLESNFDPQMLDDGFYPSSLKARVRGRGGHLSNFDSAKLLKNHGKHLKKTMLGHISHENNREELVVATHKKIIGSSFDCFLAHRYRASEVVEIE
ncbi:MAG: MBL fold metallo-hydrolase [Planctomycetia bacterium]|nr:MBL fold metallo-hydrolase [Planctomycetia bacterium]